MHCTGLVQELFYSLFVVFESRMIGKFVDKLMGIGRLGIGGGRQINDSIGNSTTFRSVRHFVSMRANSDNSQE